MKLDETIKNSISDIKKIPAIAKFLKFEEEKETEVLAEDVKSVDGTILRIEPAVEVGAQVQVIDEAGELIAAPDGQIELEDGKVLNVEGGIIVEVQGVEGEEEAPAEEEMAIEEEVATEAAPAFDLEKLQKDIISKLNVAITEKIEKLRFASVEKVTALESENTDLKTVIVEMADILEKMAGEPSAEPTKTQRNPFAKNESFKNVSNLLKKNK